MGRHARALADLGYLVIGVERDAKAIAKARELGGGPNYVQADMREYKPDCDAFDVVVIMSQSFGYFDEPTNRDVLSGLVAGLRRGGRIVLDLWNPDFFIAHQGKHSFELPGGLVREEKRVESNRLFVELSYPDGTEERFEWQLYSPDEMAALAKWVGLSLVVSCTDHDATVQPTAEQPRIQFLLERVHVS